MNDKQIDALLEQMKQRGNVARQGERSADDFLAAIHARPAVRPKLALKTALATLLVLASLGYCFHAYTAWQAEKAAAKAKLDDIQIENDMADMEFAAEAKAERPPAAKAPLAPQKAAAEKKSYMEMDASKMTISSPREKWHFLPCFGNDVRGVEFPRNGDGHFHDALPPAAEMLLSEGKLTESQREEFHWHSVNFPHRDFNRIMPKPNSYGWYGCEFDVPDALLGMDVYADLGIIDGVDETFVNGTKVGGTGTIRKIAYWRTDRLYRISSQSLTPFRNFFSVLVWNNVPSFGGIVGPPVLKAALVPPDAQWEVAFVTDSNAPVGRLNAAATFPKAQELMAASIPLAWSKSPMPWKGYAAWDENVHYAVFRTSFTLMKGDSPRRIAAPVVIDCGPVFDVAAFYLNGRRIGLVGRFPEDGEPAFTEAAERARLFVPPDAWAEDGNNELAAVVYRERGVGGLPGVPGILLHNPIADLSDNFADIHDIFNIYIQSGKRQPAAVLLYNESQEPQKDDRRRRLLLSDQACRSFLSWFDDGRRTDSLPISVIRSMSELLGNQLNESPTQPAMQAFCRVLRLAEHDEEAMAVVRNHFPSFGKACRMLTPDRSTQGDWPLFYGNRQTILPTFGKLTDLVNPLGNDLYKVETGDPNDVARRWQPREAAFVADTNAHIMPASQYMREWESAKWPLDYWRTGRLFPGAKMRRAGWWNDNGATHPFDDEGPDLSVTLSRSIVKGEMLSLHLGDFDWRKTIHPRQQSIIITDASGRFLNACWSGKSDLGVYERFAFAEETNVRFKVLKHRGACVAVSGVFIDAPGEVSEGGPEESAQPSVSMNAREALSLVAQAERTHSLPSAVDGYKRLLFETEDFDSVLWLARRLASSHSLHHVWLAMAAGRLMELKGDHPDEGRRKALKALAELCDFKSTVPFMGIFLNMAEE